VKIHLPASGPDLPVHPFTKLTALGLRRNGRPIWPVRGGSGEGDDSGSGGDGPGEGDQGKPDDLGDAGKQAIDRMKAERNQARKELSDVKGQLDKLAPLIPSPPVTRRWRKSRSGSARSRPPRNEIIRKDHHDRHLGGGDQLPVGEAVVAHRQPRHRPRGHAHHHARRQRVHRGDALPERLPAVRHRARPSPPPGCTRRTCRRTPTAPRPPPGFCSRRSRSRTCGPHQGRRLGLFVTASSNQITSCRSRTRPPAAATSTPRPTVDLKLIHFIHRHPLTS
jgi:hypothetical protein